ncbi:MAG TPA: hypothetical protein VHM25_29015 [Polyangiaceae bacterium]|nr:hypothetical protein [Polyangiaceae bacterium]
MGADQIAEIAPAVREVVDGFTQGRNLCATFEVSGGPDKWIQFTSGTINLAYPVDEDPVLLPAGLGIGPLNSLILVDWAPRTFATFNIEAPMTVRDIARIIDAMFESTLGCAGRDYSVDVEFIELQE